MFLFLHEWIHGGVESLFSFYIIPDFLYLHNVKCVNSLS